MSARKRFGQHFLTDVTVLEKIIAAIGIHPTDHFVEIGPGRGVLTSLLLAKVGRLDAIEIDRDLVALLKQRFGASPHFTLHEGDILHFDWQPLLKNTSLRLVGNLPYNITTPLLFQLFTLSHVQDMHFLLQKEVVTRLTAPAGSTHYGRLTVMAQYFAQLTSLFDVSSSAFSPPPRVESAFIRIEPYAVLPAPAKDFTVFSSIVKEAFSYRRKILANSLRKFISAHALEGLGIHPHQRPQEITVENFVKISDNVVTRS